jgi:hypothetical protein
MVLKTRLCFFIPIPQLLPLPSPGVANVLRRAVFKVYGYNACMKSGGMVKWSAQLLTLESNAVNIILFTDLKH